MRCLKLPVVAVVLLSLLASVQCVARCAAMACDRPASANPPCHRHRSPAPQQPCAAPLFVAHARPHPAPQIGAPALQATVAEIAFAAPAVWHPATRSNPLAPPPDSGGPSIAILRV